MRSEDRMTCSKNNSNSLVRNAQGKSGIYIYIYIYISASWIPQFWIRKIWATFVKVKNFQFSHARSAKLSSKELVQFLGYHLRTAGSVNQTKQRPNSRRFVRCAHSFVLSAYRQQSKEAKLLTGKTLCAVRRHRCEKWTEASTPSTNQQKIQWHK